MKSFRQKYMAAGGGLARAEQVKVTSAPPPEPAQPKLTRKQRRANATTSRRINEKIKKANALGRPISLRQGANGRLEVVMGKPKKPDPGPQPGEVIKEVEGNVLPEFPQAGGEHAHTDACDHGPSVGQMFEDADKIVEETVGV